MKKNTENSSGGAKNLPKHDALAEAIADAFSAQVGRKPKVPVADLAAALNVSESLIYQCKSGETTPSAVVLLQAGAYLGPDFMNRIAAAMGMGGLFRVERAGARVLELSASISDSNTKIMQASSDGVIDHMEAATMATDLRTKASQMMETADSLEDVAKRGGSIPVIGGKS